MAPAHSISRFSLKQLFLWLTIACAVLGAVVAFGLRGVAGSMLAFSLWMIYYGYRRHHNGVGCVGYVLIVPSAFFLYTAVMWHLIGGGGTITDRGDYPYALAQIVASNGEEVANIWVHDLGGFIDREYVWRIDLTPLLRDSFVTDYGLVPVDSIDVPIEFFTAFPRRARPSQHPDCEYFATPGFPATGRGPDGDFYFMLYDAKHERMYVWLKNNF